MTSASELIFIGTLHAGLTPHNELQAILEKYAPELLLIEISQSDIDSNNLSDYPDEMVFAFEWAKTNNIQVKGFDSKINTLMDNKTSLDNEAVIAEQKILLGKHTWIDANIDKVMRLLDTAESIALTDKSKEHLREEEMRDNINKLISNSKIVILTGVDHLPFFEKTFKNAIFPFRNNSI
jgi:hypothetical protein